MLTYGFNVWIELSVLPFLAVLTAFLFARYRTNAEINRRFRLLSLSTFTGALFEAASAMLIDGWNHLTGLNLVVRTFYYVSVNLNAYYLMRYVQEFVHVDNKKFDSFNRLLLISSFLVLILNLTPGTSGFFFIIVNGGGLFRGTYNTLWRSVYTLYFVAMALWLQVTHREYYTAKSQFIILNTIVGLLIASNVIQYMFAQTVLFTYAVAAVMLFLIFFYYEAPAYRGMLRVEEDLESARRKAEQSAEITNAANRAKSDFLANTSHEIRTPMNAILGMNEMILKESRDPEIRNASLRIRNAGNNLLSIINNILDITKIDSGKMELYKSDYHLWQLLKDIEDRNQDYDAFKEKGLKFMLDVDMTLPEHLYGDEDHIRQVLMNLIDNAVKYTPSGSITLSVKGQSAGRSGVNLTMAVKDTGIGIRSEDIGKLFQSFGRVNLNETQSIRGAGLGLTITRKLLELMNGTVKAESIYGKGSTFTVELTQELAQDGFQGTIEEYVKMIEGSETQTKIDDRPFTCPDAKILVVDDTPVNLVVAKGMLKDSRAEVDTAESGEEALEKLSAKHYDIIFLDHKMPGLDGIETLNRARGIDGPSRLSKYVALTAHSGTGLREEYISLGFSDYLPKPIKADALKKILALYIPEDLKIR
ncbi:MAG: response regulator [Synergistaceae bacterium]|nr:response regulator [Synergistaceae bacterium]MBR1658672.1 response regulator [Synergistaceae bacterium]